MHIHTVELNRSRRYPCLDIYWQPCEQQVRFITAGAYLRGNPYIRKEIKHY